MKEKAPNQQFIQPDPMPTFLWVSLFLYLLGMIFPVFYAAPAHKPLMAYEFFAWGWVGLIDLKFQWFAHSVFCIAIVTIHRPAWSFLFSLGSLLLVISFLYDEKIVVFGEDGFHQISAYGWGYCLWILSITVLTVDQLLRTIDNDTSFEVKTLIHLGCFGAVLYLFVNHHYLDKNSHYYLQKERATIFEDYCTRSKETVFRKINLGGSSIYLERESAQYFLKEKGRWKMTGYGLVQTTMVDFYETKNSRPESDQIKYPFVQVRSSRPGTPIPQITSKYSLVIEIYEFPRKLDIHGGEATVVHIQSKEVIARSSYIYDAQNGRFCGNSENGRYSVGDFLARVLGG